MNLGTFKRLKVIFKTTPTLRQPFRNSTNTIPVTDLTRTDDRQKKYHAGQTEARTSSHETSDQSRRTDSSHIHIHALKTFLQLVQRRPNYNVSVRAPRPCVVGFLFVWLYFMRRASPAIAHSLKDVNKRN